MEQKKEFIKRRLKLAQDKLKSAKLLLKYRQYRDTISRAYYSMFYSAKAYLMAKGEDPASHHGVKVLIHKLSTQKGELEPLYAKMLTVVQEERMKAEYNELSTFHRKEALQAIEWAEIFSESQKTNLTPPPHL